MIAQVEIIIYDGEIIIIHLMITIYTTKLISKSFIAEDTYQLLFEKPDQFEFIAGQYVFLDFAKPKNTDDRPSMRAMSIASAPHEEKLIFVMRKSDSAFKKNIDAMMEGDEIILKGPLGLVSLPENLHQSIIYIIAGVGITPVRSMLKQEEHIASPRAITLFYSNRTKSDIALHDELKSISLPHYQMINTLTREDGEWDGEKGRINGEMIKKYVDDIANQMYYVVGTKDFITSMQQVLEDLNIEKTKIHFDNFG